MKKFSIMLMAALALGFTACEDDETNAIPQTNPQEPMMTVEGLTVAPGDAVTEGVADLFATATAGSQVAVLQVTEVKDLPASTNLKFVMQISKNEDYSDARDVETSLVDNVVLVDPALWQEAHLAVMGKNPKAQQTYIRFAAYAVNGTSGARLGGPDYYVGQGNLSVTPYPAPFVDEVYYLMINGEKRAEFKNTGGDVYDNPTFKTKAKIDYNTDFDPETGVCFWSVVAASKGTTEARTVFAPTADDAFSEKGKMLTNTGANDIPEAGYLNSDGALIFTINVETLDFEIAPAPKEMYMIGKFCNWSWDDAAAMTPINGAPDVYWTIRYVQAGVEGFKFNSNADWDGGEMGYNQITVGSSVTTVKENGGNIDVEKSGWYIFVFDTTTAVPTLNIYNPEVYVFGAAAGGKWDAGEVNKFTVIDDPNAEWPFVSPDVLATEGNDASCLRLCIQLPGYDWWKTEFIFYEDGAIQYRGTGGDQARTGNPAGKVYLNFATGKGKAE